MYKRFLVISLLLIMTGLQAFSQDRIEREFFSHSIGFSGFGGVTPDYYGGSSYSAGGLTYSPRFNFLLLSPSSSFSFGTHLTLGGSFSTSSNGYDSQSSSTFMADIPLVIEYNFGNAATREAFKRWGFFAGGGYGWHNAKANVLYPDGYYSEDIHLAGPVISAGFRFPIANASLGCRFSYLINNHEDNPDVPISGLFGIGLEYNFGARIHAPRAAKQRNNNNRQRYYHKY